MSGGRGIRSRLAGPEGLLLLVALGALAPALFAARIPAQTDWIYSYGPWFEQKKFTPYNITGGDSFFVYTPDRLLAIEQMKAGHWPLWNPELALGVPLLASQTANPLDPLILPMFVLPPGVAMGLQYAVLLFVAGWGLMGFLRCTGLRSGPALAAAAVAFALNPYFLYWLELRVFVGGLATLPVALWALERLAEPGPRGRWAAALALALGYAVAAGNVQTLAIFLLVLGLRALWRLPLGGGSARTRWAAGAAVAGLALGLPILAGWVELFLQSSRSGSDLDYYSTINYLPWRAVALWFNPELFGWTAPDQTLLSEVTGRSAASSSGWGAMGVLGLGLAVWGAVRGATPRRERIFWGGLWLLVLVYLLLLATPLRNGARALLPIFDSVDWLRGLFAVNLAGAVLIGWGAEDLFRRWTSDRRWLWGVLAWLAIGVAAVAAGRIGLEDVPHGWLRSLAPPGIAVAAALAVGLLPGLGRARPWLLAALIALELGVLHFRFNTFAEPRSFYPDDPFATVMATPPVQSPHSRILVTERWRSMPVNLTPLYGATDLRGYGNMPLRRYRALLRLAGEEEFKNQVTIENFLHPVYRLLAANNVVQGRTLPPADWEADATVPNFFRRRDPGPRAFVAHRMEPVADPEAMAARFLDPRYRPHGTALVLQEDAPDLQAAGTPGTTPATVLHLDPKRVVLQAYLQQPGVMVLTDIAYPGWRVTVNGERADPLVAFGGLRAVRVGSGMQTVEWRYRPGWAFPSALLALAAFVLCVVWWRPPRFRPKTRART